MDLGVGQAIVKSADLNCCPLALGACVIDSIQFRTAQESGRADGFDADGHGDAL